MTPNPGTQEAIAVSEMVERVARAICDGSGGTWSGPPFDKHSGKLNDLYRHMALAAIKAMEEPTEAMVRIGEGLSDFVMPTGFDKSREGRQRELRAAYRTMISTAIQEKEV